MPKKPPKSPFDTVVGIVRRSRKGVSVADIREKTGFEAEAIRAFIAKARRKERIRSKSRGIYISANK